MRDLSCDQDEFASVNQTRLLPFGGSANRYSVPPDAVERVDRSVAFAAAKRLPELHLGAPLEHRFNVVRKYVSYPATGLVLRDGEPPVSESQNRLNTAVAEVATQAGVNPATIRDACAKAYKSPSTRDASPSESYMDAFRSDCEAILATVQGKDQIQ